MSTYLLFIVLFSVTFAWDWGPDEHRDDFHYGLFPDDFVWATATSAYQIEGAWNVSGKGACVWDTISRYDPCMVYNCDTGDIACDAYHHTEDDVQLLKDLGVSHYRFSIHWTRLLPDGTKDSLNEDGLRYYNELIDALIAAGIQPMVTLHHWDIPQDLQDNYGGWISEEIVADFKDFADVCFENFGDRVKFWITINEPWIIALFHYGYDWVHSPHYENSGVDTYLAGHNLLKAHAEAYHLYDESYRETQNGVIGITLNTAWTEPLDHTKAEDREAALRAQEFALGWFANPVYGGGDYPDTMKWRIAEKSYSHPDYNESRLPSFTNEEKEKIKGTFDFFGLNFYSSELVAPAEYSPDDVSYDNDQDVSKSMDPTWEESGSSWLKVTPWGIRRTLQWIRDMYANPPVYITENGVSDKEGPINDEKRVSFYRRYINEVLKAIDLDGCNVKGYAAWSFMDNFEWMAGYSERFGIHHVDFDDPERKRTVKDSAKFYRDLIKTNGWPEENGLANRTASVSLGLLLTTLLFWFFSTYKETSDLELSL